MEATVERVMQRTRKFQLAASAVERVVSEPPRSNSSSSDRGTTGPVQLNQRFLAHTIRDVEAHNRRDQIDSCWRQHQLQKMMKGTDERQCSYRKRRAGEVAEDYSAAREHWAAKKLQARSGNMIRDNDNINQSSAAIKTADEVESTSSSSTISSVKKSKKRKRSSKREKKKEKSASDKKRKKKKK